MEFSRMPKTHTTHQSAMNLTHRSTATDPLSEALGRADAYLSPRALDADSGRRRLRALERAREEVAELVEVARRSEQMKPDDAVATLSSRSFGFRAR